MIPNQTTIPTERLPQLVLPRLRAGISLRWFTIIAVCEALALAWLLTAPLDGTRRAATLCALLALVMAGVVRWQEAGDARA